MSEKTIEHLKREFAARWPNAERAIVGPPSLKKQLAACLWLGFKSGYALAMEEAEG